jgi:RHS repeat-associated protein
LAVITDRRTGICDDDEIEFYDAEVIDATDYYAFGSPMPGRQGIQRCTTASVLDTTTINVYNEAFTSGSIGSWTSAIGNITVYNIYPGQLKIESMWTARPSGSSPIFRVAASKTYKLSINLVDISVGTGKTHTVRVRINYPGGNITNSYTTTGIKTFTFMTTSGGNATIDVFSQITPSTPAYTPGNPYVTIDDVLISYDSTFYKNVTTCVLDKNGYRYGFNGMEKDNEHNVEGGNYDFGARIYDSRLGRWLSLDPLQFQYPDVSAYCGMGNNPISLIDKKGKYIYISSNFQNSVFYPVLTNLLSMGDNIFLTSYLCKYSGNTTLDLRLLYNGYSEGNEAHAIAFASPISEGEDQIISGNSRLVVYGFQKPYGQDDNASFKVKELTPIGAAVSLMHEIIHTNLFMENGDQEHNAIAKKHFENLKKGIETYITKFNKIDLEELGKKTKLENISMTEVVEALAWVGLDNTTTFISKFGKPNQRTEEQTKSYNRLKTLQENLLYTSHEKQTMEEMQEKENNVKPEDKKEDEKADIKVE